MRARRAARVLLGFGMLVWSGVLALYGLFAIVYDGDGGVMRTSASVGATSTRTW